MTKKSKENITWSKLSNKNINCSGSLEGLEKGVISLVNLPFGIDFSCENYNVLEDVLSFLNENI